MTAQEQSAPAPRTRDHSVDVLKGIGIIVVVMGHLDMSGVGGAWISYLYSFNVALFFIVSGYMWRAKQGVSFLQVAFRKFRQIYVPYLVLFAISLLYGHIVVRYVYGDYVIPLELRATLKALLFASDWLNTVPTFNFALWFLPIFFISSLVFELLQLITRQWIYIPVLAGILLSALLVQNVLPGRPILAINVLPVAVGFMGLGFLLRRWLNVGRLRLPVLIPLFAFTLLVTYYAPGNVAAIGTLWYFPSAMASFVLYLRLAEDIRSSRFLRYIGENSLIIFGIHGLVANTYTHTRIPAVFAGWDNGLMLYLINVAYVVLVSVLIVKGYRWVRRKVSTRTPSRRVAVNGTN